MIFSKKGKKESITELEKDLAEGKGFDQSQKEISQAAQSYAHAARWFENHIADEYKKKANNSKKLCIFFGALSFMSIGAVLGLTPLKTVIPYVIRVDNNTGYMDIVKPYNEQTGLKQSEADIESILKVYVDNRESYNFYNQDARYDIVKNMTDDNAFQEYKNFQLSHKGYVYMWADTEQVRVRVNNIYPVNSPDYNKTGIRTYQVRYTRSFFDGKGQPDPQRPDVIVLATVSFKFMGLPKTKEDQWINPKGFKAVSYQTSQEVTGGQ